MTMNPDLRIVEHPFLDFKRGPKIKIYYQGKAIEAHEGETIGAALCAADISVFTRSFKYHRPRGMFCAIGKCSSCMMRVNGMPNIKTCITPAEDGMLVEPQNCYPSANEDIFNIMNRFSFALKPKVYYKMFLRPRMLSTFFLKIIRYLSGMGSFPTSTRQSKPSGVNESRETEIAVVGSGPAGLYAAFHAANQGSKVTLIDENNRVGGQLIKQTHKFFGSKEHYAGVRGIDIAKLFAEQVLNHKNIEVLLNSFVIGIYPDNILGIVQDNKFIKLRAKKVVISTGAYERTLIFENNDIPGVMGAGGVQTLMNVHGVKPGKEALMIGAGNVGLIVSYQLLQAGVNVKAVVEAAPKIGGYFVHAAKIRRSGVPILVSHSIKGVWGKNRVEGAKIVQLDEKWQYIPNTDEDVKCDLICVATGLRPTYELLYQAGAKMKLVPELGGHVPLRTKSMETTTRGIYIAGDACGIEEASTAMVAGRVAGISAALSLGYGDERTKELREKAIGELENMRSGPTGEKIRKGTKEVTFGD